MRVLKDFDIADRVLAITTDEGENIKAACKTTENYCRISRKKGKTRKGIRTESANNLSANFSTSTEHERR